MARSRSLLWWPAYCSAMPIVIQSSREQSGSSGPRRSHPGPVDDLGACCCWRLGLADCQQRLPEVEQGLGITVGIFECPFPAHGRLARGGVNGGAGEEVLRRQPLVVPNTATQTPPLPSRLIFFEGSAMPNGSVNNSFA